MRGIDANIIVYAINKDLPEHLPCKMLLKQVANGEEVISIPAIVLMESFHALVYVYKFTAKRVIERLNSLIDSNFINILNITTGSTLIAFELAKSYKTGGRDSLIAASLLENSIYELYSHDKDFDSIDEIRRIDPVRDI